MAEALEYVRLLSASPASACSRESDPRVRVNVCLPRLWFRAKGTESFHKIYFHRASASYQNAECTGSGGRHPWPVTGAVGGTCVHEITARLSNQTGRHAHLGICTDNSVVLHTKWQIGGPCPPAPPDLFCASPGIVLAALLCIYHHSNDVFLTNYIPSSHSHPKGFSHR